MNAPGTSPHSEAFACQDNQETIMRKNVALVTAIFLLGVSSVSACSTVGGAVAGGAVGAAVGNNTGDGDAKKGAAIGAAAGAVAGTVSH